MGKPEESLEARAQKLLGEWPGSAVESEMRGVIKELLTDLTLVRSAIIEHRAQKADDRCIEDDDKLYAALGDGVKCDRRVGDKDEMLRNCQRFIERRCEGGGWKSYAQLEAEIADLKLRVQEAHSTWKKRCAMNGVCYWSGVTS